jgi:serine/threonine protein kinase
MKIIDYPSLVEYFRGFDITENSLESSLMREIEVMRRLRHRNIVHYEGSFRVGEKVFLCMEYVEGRDLIRIVPPGGLSQDIAKDLFFQLCSAVAYCHANNVRAAIPSFLSPFSLLSLFPLFLSLSPFSLTLCLTLSID